MHVQARTFEKTLPASQLTHPCSSLCCISPSQTSHSRLRNGRNGCWCRSPGGGGGLFAAPPATRELNRHIGRNWCQVEYRRRSDRNSVSDENVSIGLGIAQNFSIGELHRSPISFVGSCLHLGCYRCRPVLRADSLHFFSALGHWRLLLARLATRQNPPHF